MAPEGKRSSYTISYKLQVLNYTQEYGISSSKDFNPYNMMTHILRQQGAHDISNDVHTASWLLSAEMVDFLSRILYEIFQNVGHI
ncbi:hypothetical protein E2C01_097358 [Portunus trituberculatus]|uniref:Uncharacterized protein n=1 Tax=Portunus trituberculatus TaxID=210409 RepID=A0A5B7K079_PORTR|nr:hypothetical protein [Portunus trituberculatus]